MPLALLAMGFSARGLAGLKPMGLRSRIDYSGALLMMAAVAAALFGLSTGGVDVPWLSAEVLGVFVLAASFLRCWCCSRGARKRRFFRLAAGQAGLPGASGISFANAAAMFGAIFLLPLMLQWLYHQGARASGLALVPFLFGTTAGPMRRGR